MILFGILRTEEPFLTPEKTIGCVLVASHIQQSRRHKTSFCDEASRGCNGFVFTRFEMVGGDVSQNTLTGEAAATDALAFLGHQCTPGMKKEDYKEDMEDPVDGIPKQLLRCQ